MRQEYNRLDPVNLLKRVSHCQETFWQYAWSKQSSQVKLAVTDITSAPCPEAGDSNKDEGTTLNSIVSLSRQYRRTNKPRKEMGPRTWRTRQDSFAPVWDKLRLQLELNPRITAKVLLDQLIIEQPEKLGLVK